MKAISIKNGKGDASALFVDDNVPDPPSPPPGNRILVRIHAFGLNKMDIMQREDRYPYPLPPESGDILGVEFSGVVEEKGPECSDRFRVGERVFGLAYGGAVRYQLSVYVQFWGSGLTSEVCGEDRRLGEDAAFSPAESVV